MATADTLKCLHVFVYVTIDAVLYGAITSLSALRANGGKITPMSIIFLLDSNIFIANDTIVDTKSDAANLAVANGLGKVGKLERQNNGTWLIQPDELLLTEPLSLKRAKLLYFTAMAYNADDFNFREFTVADAATDNEYSDSCATLAQIKAVIATFTGAGKKAARAPGVQITNLLQNVLQLLGDIGTSPKTRYPSGTLYTIVQRNAGDTANENVAISSLEFISAILAQHITVRQFAAYFANSILDLYVSVLKRPPLKSKEKGFHGLAAYFAFDVSLHVREDRLPTPKIKLTPDILTMIQQNKFALINRAYEQEQLSTLVEFTGYKPTRQIPDIPASRRRIMPGDA